MKTKYSKLASTTKGHGELWNNGNANRGNGLKFTGKVLQQLSITSGRFPDNFGLLSKRDVKVEILDKKRTQQQRIPTFVAVSCGNFEL